MPSELVGHVERIHGLDSLSIFTKNFLKVIVIAAKKGFGQT